MHRSAIYVNRIKNQHQPIILPQWNNTATSHLLALDNSDNQSVISFGQRSHMNFDAGCPSFIPTSAQSLRSASAESSWEQAST
jgi:hypothetical protein